MSTPRVTLSKAQLRDVELALAGLWDGLVTLSLPASAAVGATLELVDAEGTAIATLEVDTAVAAPVARHGMSTIGVGEAPEVPTRSMCSGRVSALRPFGHRDQFELRATTRPRHVRRALVITGDVPDADDPGWTRASADAVVILDHGDPRGLASAVRDVRARGMEPVVLPAPSTDGRSPRQWVDAVGIAARRLVADEITIRETLRRPGPGRVILLTGLSGSGKSTIANLLVQRLAEQDPRSTSLLDGDELRLILSAGLGFSREDRLLNVRRIGWVAALVAAHGGIAVCAPIAPYRVMRQEMRDRAEAVGRFLLVHVSTPIEVCEQRDRKGLYALAREGKVPQFTGISDPYEIPDDADVVIDGSAVSPEAAVGRILDALHRMDRDV